MSLSFPVQTERGIGQGKMAGQLIKDYITEDGDEPMLYFYMSPYKRSLQTFEALASNFTRAQIKGCQEEVDFGNFQVRLCWPLLPPATPAFQFTDRWEFAHMEEGNARYVMHANFKIVRYQKS